MVPDCGNRWRSVVCKITNKKVNNTLPDIFFMFFMHYVWVFLADRYALRQQRIRGPRVSDLVYDKMRPA